MLFPAPYWSILAAVGALGFVVAATNRSTRCLAAIPLAVLLVNLLHFAGAKRCPYPRVCGYFLPLMLIGLGLLAERAVAAFGGGRRPVVGGCLALISSAAVVLLCPPSAIATKVVDVAPGDALAGAGGLSVPASLVALAAFLCGAAAGGRIGARFGDRRFEHLRAANSVTALLLVAAAVLAAVVGQPRTSLVTRQSWLRRSG
jgi:hypothetical protein